MIIIYVDPGSLRLFWEVFTFLFNQVTCLGSDRKFCFAFGGHWFNVSLSLCWDGLGLFCTQIARRLVRDFFGVFQVLFYSQSFCCIGLGFHTVGAQVLA